MEIAPEVTVTTASERGKNPIITLESFDKQLIGQVAAKIKSMRKPEPYKVKVFDLLESTLEEKQVSLLLNNISLWH